MLQELLHGIERSEALDRIAEPLDQVARPLLRGEPASRLLSGAWMGHRLHPLLTDLVIGTWLSASLLDTVGGAAARPQSRRLIGLGIISALPTVAAGVHDWLDYGPKVRRSGVVHALANTIGLSLQLASWAARRGGRNSRGAWLSLGALTATGIGGYLGGHLSYVLGAGVERTAFSEAPSDWTPALAEADLGAEPQSVDVGGLQVLVVRDGSDIRALADTCNHAGCSLAQGEVAGGAVTCACHGSRFRLADGETLRGPASAPQPAFQTRLRDGMIEVRERPAGA